MGELKVTAKGQVTLRKDLLEHLGIGPGDKIEVDKLAGSRLQIRAKAPQGHISAIFGALKSENGPRLTVEEINEIAAQGWANER
jgi:bifunctional DNA-binding transcriptional regulator/antitoxin component of YhaV-PrlF toxin-antitoxin module